MEEIFRNGGVKPAGREKLGDWDVFIGDGFSLPPHRAYWRFGVEPEEFDHGMYVTWWWLGKDEKLDVGQPIFFDVLHNPEYSSEDKKQSRINAAVRAAKYFLTRRKVNGKAH